MNISKYGQKLLGLGLAALITIVLNTPARAQKVTGAIFTTNANSEYVNGNVYDSGGNVYLNGGPRPNAPCTAAGLPDGDYYFQVTDPSGATLLSTDAISNRMVTVIGGLMVAYSGGHDTGAGKCIAINPNNITVALWPFKLTPNPGGEYKVWMTKAGDYSKCNFNEDPSTYDPSISDPKLCSGSFGFIPSKSKTDNFKVIPPESAGSTCDVNLPWDANCGLCPTLDPTTNQQLCPNPVWSIPADGRPEGLYCVPPEEGACPVP